MNKKIAGVGIAGTVAATAVTALLLGASPAMAEEGAGFGSAYAFAASGLVDIDPIPAVESDGELVRKELLSVGERTELEDAGIFVGVLNVAAEAGRAETSVLRLELLELLRADVFRTYCDGDEGGVDIVKGTLLGQQLPDSPVPSQTVDASPLATVSFNNQVRNTDGSLTVTGLELTLLPGRGDGENERLTAADRASLPLLGDLLGAELPTTLLTEDDVLGELTSTLGVDLDEALQTITVGSVTCGDDGKKDDGTNDDGADDGKDEDGTDDDGTDEDAPAGGANIPADGGSAPAPTVVQASLPVTG